MQRHSRVLIQIEIKRKLSCEKLTNWLKNYMHAWNHVYVCVKIRKHHHRPLEILAKQKQQSQWVCYVCMNDGHLVIFPTSLFNTFHEYLLDLCAMLHTFYTLLFVCFVPPMFPLPTQVLDIFSWKNSFFHFVESNPGSYCTLYTQ